MEPMSSPIAGTSGMRFNEANNVEEVNSNLGSITGRKRKFSAESVDSQKRRADPEFEEMTPCQPLISIAPLSCNLLFRKILAGAAYGAEASIYNPSTVEDLELSTPQSLLLGLLHSLVSGDVMSSVFLAAISFQIKRLRSRHLRVWLLEDFRFPRTDIEDAMTLLEVLISGNIIKLPVHVMTLMTSLAKKYRIAGVELSTLSEECCSDLAIEVESAVSNNCPRNIFDLESEGADFHGLTQSGDSLMHLAARSGSSASITALTMLDVDLEILNSKNATPLEEAVRSDRGSSVKALLKAGAKFNKRFSGGDTYLHIAASGGHNDALEALLRGAMDINEKNTIGETALFQAVKVANARAIELLLQNGADTSDILNVKFENGDSIVHSLALSGNISVLKVMKDRGIKANIKNDKGLTPLHGIFNPSVVRMLLKMGVDVNSQDNENNTPLITAERNCKTDIVSLLLLNRADPNIKNHKNKTALHYAVERGCVETVTTLLDAGATAYLGSGYSNWDKETPVYIALKNNEPEILQLLLEKSDLSQRDEYGNGILQNEAGSGHLEVVKVLLDAGVEVDMKGQYEKTALHCAASNGHTEVVGALIAAGADVNAKEESGWTALHFAASSEHTEVVRVLLAAGAAVNAKSKDQSIALHRTAYNRQTAVVTALLDGGAEVNARDKDQKTAIHYAAKQKNIKVIKVLLERGADPSAKDAKGYTALMETIRFDQFEIVKLLVEHGANVWARDNNGWDAYKYADKYNKPHIMSYLRNKK